MKDQADEILRAAMSLPPDERARVARELLVSLNPEELELDPETLAQLEKTAEDVLAGREPTVPWSVVREQLLEKYKR